MKINSVTRLTQQKWLNLYEADFTHVDKNGVEKHGKWQFASRQQNYEKNDKPNAVIIVPITDTSVYLIKEYRVPLQGYELAFPAGLIDENESVEICAARELFEETGLKIERILHVSPSLISSAGLSDEKVVMVFARVTGEPTNAHVHGTEEIEIVEIKRDEFTQFLANPSHPVSAKTWPFLFGISISSYWFDNPGVLADKE